MQPTLDQDIKRNLSYGFYSIIFLVINITIMVVFFLLLITQSGKALNNFFRDLYLVEIGMYLVNIGGLILGVLGIRKDHKRVRAIIGTIGNALLFLWFTSFIIKDWSLAF